MTVVNEADAASAGRRIGVREFRGSMAEYLREARNGTSFLITSHDEVVAELRPPPVKHAERQPGALQGKIRMADDFDEWPPDIQKTFESGEL